MTFVEMKLFSKTFVHILVASQHGTYCKSKTASNCILSVIHNAFLEIMECKDSAPSTRTPFGTRHSADVPFAGSWVATPPLLRHRIFIKEKLVILLRHRFPFIFLPCLLGLCPPRHVQFPQISVEQDPSVHIASGMVFHSEKGPDALNVALSDSLIQFDIVDALTSTTALHHELATNDTARSFTETVSV